MAGLNLNVGLGSLGYGGAATPAAASASPQGPTTVSQKAFGVVTGGSASNVPGTAICVGGLVSLGLLIFIWYSLPR